MANSEEEELLGKKTGVVIIMVIVAIETGLNCRYKEYTFKNKLPKLNYEKAEK